MTIAVYIRVSSPKGQKTDSQRAEVEAWINRHRIRTVHLNFRESQFQQHLIARQVASDRFHSMIFAALFPWYAGGSRPVQRGKLPAERTAMPSAEQTESLSLRRAPTCLLEQVMSFSRYQLNSRTAAERLPKVAGNRKSSAAANSHGVLWKRAWAEKNLSGSCGLATPYLARQSLSTFADTVAALMPWPNLGL